MDSALYLNYSGVLLIDEANNEIYADEFMSFVEHKINRNKRFELINGRIMLMAGNVTLNHQKITRYLLAKIYNYLEGKPCEVFYDFNLHLFREELGKCKNVYQPDIMVCCDEKQITRTGVVGVPELVIEVISKTTARNDYHDKCVNYIEFGVKEYWIADLFENQIVVYINNERRSPAIHTYTFGDIVKTTVFPELAIDFNEILKAVDRSNH